MRRYSIKISTKGSSRYMIAIVDYYSVRVFVYLLKSRDECYKKFKEIIVKHQNKSKYWKLNTLVKCVRVFDILRNYTQEDFMHQSKWENWKDQHLIGRKDETLISVYWNVNIKFRFSIKKQILRLIHVHEKFIKNAEVFYDVWKDWNHEPCMRM